jgi:hypothetical protein
VKLFVRSSLPAEDLLRLLGEDVDLERLALVSFSGYAGERPIIARFFGSQFRMHRRRHYRNGFAPFLYGEVKATSEGSEISGEFRLPAFTRIVMALWFALVLADSVGLAMSSHADARALLTAFAMPLVGGAMAFLGRYIAHHDPAFIRRYLERCASNEGPPRYLARSPYVAG